MFHIKKNIWQKKQQLTNIMFMIILNVVFSFNMYFIICMVVVILCLILCTLINKILF